MNPLVRLLGVLLPACIFFSFPVIAQPDEKFGKISSHDINLKECAFDPEASAAILIDEGNSSHDEQHRLITNIHRRIKILKTPGIEESNVSIYFRHDEDFEFISNIVAVTFNIDENGTINQYPVDRKSIYKKKLTTM